MSKFLKNLCSFLSMVSVLLAFVYLIFADDILYAIYMMTFALLFLIESNNFDD